MPLHTAGCHTRCSTSAAAACTRAWGHGCRSHWQAVRPPAASCSCKRCEQRWCACVCVYVVLSYFAQLCVPERTNYFLVQICTFLSWQQCAQHEWPGHGTWQKMARHDACGYVRVRCVGSEREAGGGASNGKIGTKRTLAAQTYFSKWMQVYVCIHMGHVHTYAPRSMCLQGAVHALPDLAIKAYEQDSIARSRKKKTCFVPIMPSRSGSTPEPLVCAPCNQVAIGWGLAYAVSLRWRCASRTPPPTQFTFYFYINAKCRGVLVRYSLCSSVTRCPATKHLCSPSSLSFPLSLSAVRKAYFSSLRAFQVYRTCDTQCRTPTYAVLVPLVTPSPKALAAEQLPGNASASSRYNMR